MKLVVDEDHLGTPEAAWRSSDVLGDLPALAPGRPRRVIVIAPHPDDEILGAGGLIQSFIASGVPVEVLAVTDGEGSHPGATAARTAHLRETRTGESVLALRRLGSSMSRVTRLGIPDGGVSDAEGQVRDALEQIGEEGDLWLTPWWLDGHPDHDSCGRAAAAAAAQLGVRALHYLVWAWHWADPRRQDIPWANCSRFDFDRHVAERKRWGIEAFASQIHPLGPDAGDAAVLPPAVLSRFHRTFEVFVEGTR